MFSCRVFAGFVFFVFSHSFGDGDGVVFVIVLLGWGVFFVCLLWSLEFSCEDHSLQIPGRNKHQVKADGTVQLQNETIKRRLVFYSDLIVRLWLIVCSWWIRILAHRLHVRVQLYFTVMITVTQAAGGHSNAALLASISSVYWNIIFSNFISPFP